MRQTIMTAWKVRGMYDHWKKPLARERDETLLLQFDNIISVTNAQRVYAYLN